MKKIVLICGLIAGVIVSTLMLINVINFYRSGDYEGSIVFGYATMLLAFSMIFVGIKNYRDKHNNGTISFGKAFRIGFYITLIASTMYVVVWIVSYKTLVPDFMEKYTAHVIQQAQSSGASQAEINSKVAEMESAKEMYKNPVWLVLMTYAEILPVGLIVSLICAVLLKRKRQSEPQPAL